MSKGRTFQAEMLDFILNNVGVALIGDATGLLPSAANGSLYLALHSSDPGETGAQSAGEISYTGYARKAVARNPSSREWTVTVASPGSAQNANVQEFPEKTGGTDVTPTHFSIGTAGSGTGKVLYKGALTATIEIQDGITPRYPAGAFVITEE